MSAKRLDHYELINEVGRGGGGTVWRARDIRLGREVAIKVLSAENSLDPHRRERFLLEAKAASALNHPNIVSIHEINSAEGRDFIVMEYVRGTPLSALIPPGGMRLGELLAVAAQIADALATAHTAGIVHRDVKPSNVMVDEKGRVRVLDFGLAKLMRGASLWKEDGLKAEPHTLQGVILGTTWYMSPEQASGLAVDARSDIFSFGSVLFEMATGRKPFVGENDLATLRRICTAAPPRLEELRGDLPEPFRRMVYRLLEKEPSARYAGMAEVAAELQGMRGTPSAGTPLQTTAVMMGRSAGRWKKRWLIPVLGAIAAVAAGGAIPAVRNRAADWIRAGRSEWTGRGAYELYAHGKKALERYDRSESREQAMALFRQAIARDRKHALAYAGLAETLWRDWREHPDPSLLAEARESAERSVQLGRHFAVVHAILGIIQSESGQLPQGRDSLLRALDLDPRCHEAHYLLALFSTERDDWEPAQRHVERAIALMPAAWQNYHLQACIFHRRGHYDDAIRAFQAALQHAPDNAPALRDLAASFHQAGRYEEAASALQKSLTIQPSHRAYNSLGTLRFFQGRYAEAVQLMEKATELAPTRYLTWGNLADAYRWTPGAEKKSRDAFQVALRLVQQRLDSHPADVSARSSLAVYLAKTGQPEEALAVLQSLAESALERADVRFKTAVVNELAGRRIAALEHLERSLAIGYAMREVEADPELARLRNDVRYQRMLTRVADARQKN